MSNLINLTLLKEQLKRFYLIPAVMGFIYILSFLDILYVSENNNDRAVRRLVEIITGDDLLFWAGSILLPLIAVACVMSFFVSQKSGTAFYSFPIKKDSLLITNAIAGIILTLAPVVLLSLFMFIPVRYETSWMGTTTMMNHATGIITHAIDSSTPIFPRGVEFGDTINTFSVVLGFLVRISITKLFYFGVFWLAFSLTGHGFVAMLLSLFIPLFPAGMMGLLTGIGRMFIYGYHGGVQNNFMSGLIWTNPVWHTWLAGERAMDSVVAITLWYLLLTIIVLVSAFFISRLRMVERFEQMVMFSQLKQIMIFVVALVVMVVVAVFLMLFLPSSSSVFYASLVIGFIIGFYVAQSINAKSILVGLKIKELLAHSAVVFGMLLVILVSTQFGMGFYVNRIPARENIVGVFPGSINLNWEGRDYLFLRDSDSISSMMSIHQQLLDEQNSLFMPVWRGAHSHPYTLYLTYLLDNGRTMQRRYVIPRDFMLREEIKSLKTGETLVFHRFSWLNQPEYIWGLTIGTWGDFDEEISIFEQNQIALFTEAIKQDLLYQTTREYIFRHTMDVDRGGWLRQGFQSTHDSLIITMHPFADTSELFTTFNNRVLLVLPNNTMNLMEEWGLYT